jgi:hypothetical protein
MTDDLTPERAREMLAIDTMGAGGIATRILAQWKRDRARLATVTEQRDALVPLFEAVEWARVDDNQADAVLDAVRAIRAERATTTETPE